MFNDIADFFTPPVQTMLPHLHEGNLLETKLLPLVVNGTAVKSILVLVIFTVTVTVL